MPLNEPINEIYQNKKSHLQFPNENILNVPRNTNIRSERSNQLRHNDRDWRFHRKHQEPQNLRKFFVFFSAFLKVKKFWFTATSNSVQKQLRIFVTQSKNWQLISKQNIFHCYILHFNSVENNLAMFHLYNFS